MTTVLIAVDGSESDRAVARRAVDLFGESSSYIVINVSSEPAVIGASSISYAAAYSLSVPQLSRFADGVDHDADMAEDIASGVAGAVGLEDAVARGEIGDPATVLIEVADAQNVDVIVVGASDRGRLSHFFDPPVGGAVIDRSHHPVLVVPS